MVHKRTASLDLERGYDAGSDAHEGRMQTARRQELAVDPRFKNVVPRMKIVDEIDSIISAWSKTQTRDEVIAAMMEQGIPCSPVRTATLRVKVVPIFWGSAQE